MSPRPSAARPAWRAAALALAVTAAAAPTAFASEIVSRVGGPDSLPFPASLGPASADGRYVVLHLGTPNSRTTAPGPEATVTSPSGYVLRDRVAQTITPIDLESTEAPLPSTIAQISNDGKRLLLRGQDAAPVVYDLATGTTLPLPTTTGRVIDARLSEDGTQAVVGTTSAAGVVDATATGTIFRGPIGGAGTPVIQLHGLGLFGASADLQTILYTRTLATVTNPAYPTKTFTGKVIGIKQGAGAPHVIAQSFHHETRRSATTCSPDYYGIRTQEGDVYPAALSADGGRAAWSVNGSDSEYQGLTSFNYRVRSAAGEIKSYDKVAYYSPTFEALARTHDVALIPQVIFKDNPTYYWRTFVNDDKTVLTSDYGGDFSPGPRPTRYVTADDYDPGTTTAPHTLSFMASEPVDSDSLAPDVTWASCAGAPAPPVAPATTYVSFTKANPLRSSASMGHVFFIPNWAGYRTAKSATVEVKAFGMTVWKRTITPTSITNLPRPWAFIPMTVKVTVQAEDGDGVTPAPVSTQWAVYTTR